MGRPWDDDAEHRLHPRRPRAGRARRLSSGIQYVWEVEHHFLEEYSHSSAPEVFLAACSQRTTNIRLGHGIVLTAPQFNHPARVAERIAHARPGVERAGRVRQRRVVQRGRAGRVPARPAARSATRGWRGSRRALRCMVEAPFTGVDGEFVHDAAAQRRAQADAEAAPAAVGGVQPARHDPARRQQGDGRADLRLHRPRGSAVSWVTEYERTLADQCVPVGLAVNPQVACVSPMMVHHDEDEAIRRGAEGANFFGYTPRPLLRLRQAPARPHRRLGRVRRAPGRPGLRPRGGRPAVEGRAPRAPRWRPATRPGCAAASARPPRRASTCAATRRPASTR